MQCFCSPFFAIFVSSLFHRDEQKTIEHDRAKAVLHHLLSIDFASTSRVFRTLGIDSGKRENHHPAARIVKVNAVERLSQCVVVDFINITRKATWLLGLIHALVVFLVNIVVRVRMVKMNGLSNFISRRWRLSDSFCAKARNSEKNVVAKKVQKSCKGNMLENDKNSRERERELKERGRVV